MLSRTDSCTPAHECSPSLDSCQACETSAAAKVSLASKLLDLPYAPSHVRMIVAQPAACTWATHMEGAWRCCTAQMCSFKPRATCAASDVADERDLRAQGPPGQTRRAARPPAFCVPASQVVLLELSQLLMAQVTPVVSPSPMALIQVPSLVVLAQTPSTSKTTALRQLPLSPLVTLVQLQLVTPSPSQQPAPVPPSPTSLPLIGSTDLTQVLQLLVWACFPTLLPLAPPTSSQATTTPRLVHSPSPTTVLALTPWF